VIIGHLVRSDLITNYVAFVLNAAIEISLAWQDANGQWLISKSKLARLRAGETVIIFILRVPQKMKH